MISHFPKNQTPWAIQIKTVEAIEQAIKSNFRYICIEAPVASGKSSSAITVANWSESAYVVMPRKQLQGQYRDTFEGDVRLVKGRASVPCTFNNPEKNKKVIAAIKEGKHIHQPAPHESCASAPCQNCRQPKRKQVLEECEKSGACPYTAMISEACRHHVVIANNHAFFFMAQNGSLPKRKVLVLDECHGLHVMLRDMLTMKFTINRRVLETELVGIKTPQQFVNWLKLDEQFLTIKNDGRESYLARLEKFETAGEAVYGKQAIVQVHIDKDKTSLEFIPAYVGSAAHTFFFDYADIIVFLSGTIGKIEDFARPLGIKPEEVSYKRLVSEIPATNRPVVLPRLKNCDLSHKGWETNLPVAIEEIKRILHHHKDVKCAIQAPSYRTAEVLLTALQSTGRMIGHTSDNFTTQLQTFYESPKPLVFISPSIREGVDMKNDLCRAQIIIRPPYAPITDPYYRWLISNGRWDLYYRAAAIEFLQMLGRPVRSKDDFGVTYLISSTFVPFLDKISGQLPAWVKESFVK